MSGGIGALRIGSVLLAVSVSLSFCRTMPANGGAGEPALEFAVLGQAEPAVERAPTIEKVDAGRVRVTGAIATPTPCYTIEAGLVAAERTLTLTLTANAKEGICVQALAAFEYRATISGLEPGDYTIVVVQTYPGTGWPRREHRLPLAMGPP